MRTAEEIIKDKNRRNALKYYYEHREYCQARQREYYHKNKERISEERKKPRREDEEK
jgi:hypothetical protein